MYHVQLDTSSISVCQNDLNWIRLDFNKHDGNLTHANLLHTEEQVSLYLYWLEFAVPSQNVCQMAQFY